MVGTTEERQLAMEMFGNILHFAMQESRWWNGLDQYEFYDETGGKPSERLVGISTTALVRHLWTKYYYHDEEDYFKQFPVVKTIRLRYRQKSRPDISLDLDPRVNREKTKKRNTSTKKPKEPVIMAAKIWSERFTTLAKCDPIIHKERRTPTKLAEMFLGTLDLESRQEQGRKLISQSPHVLEGDLWIALLVIVLLPLGEMRTALKSIGFKGMNNWYRDTILESMKIYHRFACEEVWIVTRVLRIFDIMIDMGQHHAGFEGSMSDDRGDGDDDTSVRDEPVDQDSDKEIQRALLASLKDQHEVQRKIKDQYDQDVERGKKSNGGKRDDFIDEMDEDFDADLQVEETVEDDKGKTAQGRGLIKTRKGYLKTPQKGASRVCATFSNQEVMRHRTERGMGMRMRMMRVPVLRSFGRLNRTVAVMRDLV
jgi:hypothetical protein